MSNSNCAFLICISVLCLSTHYSSVQAYTARPVVRALQRKLESSPLGNAIQGIKKSRPLEAYAADEASTNALSLSGDADESVDEADTVTVAELVKFGLPTLGIWLLQPILSLIDSSVVGMSRSATISEFAGLGPGIAWIDSTSYLMNFLGIAVTNLYANAYANNDHDECYRVLRSGKSIGIMLGVVLLFVQLNLAQRFIGILAGPNLEIVPYAMKYAKIRALGALAAVPTIAIQAAFLASKDSVTPLVAVMVGAVVNLVGDLVLVNGFNMGIVGAAWATMLSQVMSYIYLLRSEHKLRKNVVTSVAVRVPIEAPTDNDVVRLGKDVDPVTGAVSIKMTVDKKSSSGSGSSEAIELGTGSSIGSGSSVSSASGSTGDWGIASSMTKSKMRLGGGSVQQQQEQNYGGEATSAEEALDVLESTVEAFPVPIQEATAQATTITATLIEDLPEVPAKVQREGRSSLLGPFYMPTRKEISEYFSFCGPVFCILLLKTSLWNSTTVAVAPSGAAALAAHQILINFFLYFVIFGDVLSQCSQTYLPALIKRTRKNMSNSFAPARKLVLTTLKLAAIVGVLNSLVGVGLVKFAVGSITPSKEIHEWTLTAATGFAMTILPHACLSSFEGVIMATRDIRFQSLIYFITSVSFVAYQVWVQKQSMGIKYVWYGFSAYQWVRLAFFAGRVKHRMGKVRMQSRDLSLREGPGAIDNQGQQQQQQLAM